MTLQLPPLCILSVNSILARCVALGLRASSPFRGYLEKLTRERYARGDAKLWGGAEKGRLATIYTHIFHFHPGNPGIPQSVKTVTANVPQIRKVTRLSSFDSRERVEFIYLNRFRNSFPLHQSNVFDHWYVFFIHWTSNFSVSARIRTQYFHFRFVYIWKVATFRRLSSPSQSQTFYICPFRWRTAFSWTWFSYVLLQLLPTLSNVLFDGQLLILILLIHRSYVIMYMFLNFSTWWNSVGRRNRRWKAAI